MALLEIRGLAAGFRRAHGTLPVVRGVDISVGAGEAVGVVGESGCGKTVTSLAVMGLLSQNAEVSGEILFDGRDLLALSREEMRRVRGSRIAMIFQEPAAALDPVLTIGRQLTEQLIRSGASRAAAEERALQMLEAVRVSGGRARLKSYPHELSGGLCQRVMIAMALMQSPSLLIADEPTTALDVTIQAQILRLLLDLRESTGAAIMLITHDLGVVAEVCDRVCVMYAGQVVESAGVCEIFDEPLHPYTYGLMRSMPRPGARPEQGELFSIPGTPPTPDELPDGCSFAPRCPEARPICRSSQPELCGAKHTVRCWKYAPAS